MERKLKYMPYAKAKIIKSSDGNIYLQSYQTIVAAIEDGKLFVYGLYSATTRRHISAFAKELGLNYKTFKQLYEDSLCMDINTGEVSPIKIYSFY